MVFIVPNQFLLYTLPTIYVKVGVKMSDGKLIFKKNLLKYLNASNKTQKEVADAIRVSPQTFNTWCQGIALPRMEKLQLLADYFHITKSDLIEEKVDFKKTSNTY